MQPYSSINSPFRSMYQGFPWKHSPDNGFGFISQKGPFSPAFNIKLLPLKDMSRAADVKYDAFDEFVSQVRSHVKKGDLVKAIKVNNQYKEGPSAVVLGRISDVTIDFNHKRIRTFVRDMKTNDICEVYTETIFRDDINMNESKFVIPSFSQYILG